MEYPKCPHCKHQFNDEEIWGEGLTEFPTENDGDETDTKCLSCGEALRISIFLTPSWEFLDEDGDEIT